VGESGAKNGASWPATMEVFFQSKPILAERSRTSPALSPSGADGNPTKKSNFTSPPVLAPFHSGPNTSRLTSDCLTVAPKLPLELPGSLGCATLGTSI
jgi:hypothetical protein